MLRRDPKTNLLILFLAICGSAGFGLIGALMQGFGARALTFETFAIGGAALGGAGGVVLLNLAVPFKPRWWLLVAPGFAWGGWLVAAWMISIAPKWLTAGRNPSDIEDLLLLCGTFALIGGTLLGAFLSHKRFAIRKRSPLILAPGGFLWLFVVVLGIWTFFNV